MLYIQFEFIERLCWS